MIPYYENLFNAMFVYHAWTDRCRVVIVKQWKDFIFLILLNVSLRIAIVCFPCFTRRLIRFFKFKVAVDDTFEDTFVTGISNTSFKKNVYTNLKIIFKIIYLFNKLNQIQF